MPRSLANSAFMKPFVVLALPGMYLFYKYNQYKQQQQEQSRRKVTERELAHLNHKIVSGGKFYLFATHPIRQKGFGRGARGLGTFVRADFRGQREIAIRHGSFGEERFSHAFLRFFSDLGSDQSSVGGRSLFRIFSQNRDRVFHHFQFELGHFGQTAIQFRSFPSDAKRSGKVIRATGKSVRTNESRPINRARAGAAAKGGNEVENESGRGVSRRKGRRRVKSFAFSRGFQHRPRQFRRVLLRRERIRLSEKDSF